MATSTPSGRRICSTLPPVEGGEFGLPPTLSEWRIWLPPLPPICVALHIFTERSQLSPDRNVKKLNEILRKK